LRQKKTEAVYEEGEDRGSKRKVFVQKTTPNAAVGPFQSRDIEQLHAAKPKPHRRAAAAVAVVVVVAAAALSKRRNKKSKKVAQQ
jgi:hypothetical protein